MTVEERRALEALQHLPEADEDDLDYEIQDITLSDILDGSVPLDISHGGGEFAELTKALRASLSKDKYVI
jgi:hypothetical protein